MPKCTEPGPTVLHCEAQTTIECVLTIEEVSPAMCRQTLEGDVTIRIPGVGSIAERIIRQSLKDVYSNIPQVVDRCAVPAGSKRIAVRPCLVPAGTGSSRFITTDPSCCQACTHASSCVSGQQTWRYGVPA